MAHSQPLGAPESSTETVDNFVKNFNNPRMKNQKTRGFSILLIF